MTQLRAHLQHDQLPADARVDSVEAREGLSVLFDVAIEFLTHDPDLDLEALVGTSGSARVDSEDGDSPVVWHGQIQQAAYLRTVGDQHAYRLTLRPVVAGLAHRVRSRTFQDKDVRAIVTAVLKDAGVPEDGLVWHLTQSYVPRPFCLQYKESELAFVLRLLEDEGIFFWFEHTDDGHVMHLGDAPSAHAPIEGEPALSASPELHEGRTSLTGLVLETRVTEDAHALRDWNFERPANPVEGEFRAAGAGNYEVYEYPGGFMEGGEGLRRSRNRARAAQVRHTLLRGTTNARNVVPGRKLTVVESSPPVFDGEWLVIESTRVYREPVVGTHSERRQFVATWRAMPAALEFRPRRTTPRPRVCGKEGAVVTGPAGEEIHVDDYGRIKVHFYWDREGKIDDTASFWIRVQQQNTSGSMILPRVGWEVDVGFLDGDPDRPVVLQKLYNRETMPPYGLPDNKTQSALQSSSSPGGGGTNEVRLQDGNGGMEFFVHASRDFSLRAGHDMTETIAVDVLEDVGLERKENVAGNDESQVGSNQSLNVTGDLSQETVGSKTISVGAVDDWGITGAYSITVDGARTDDVGSMMNVLANRVTETFNANHTRTVGAAQCINSVGSVVEAVGGAKTESVGAAKLELVRKDKGEEIEGSKTLTSGAMMVKTGKDITVSAEAALAITVAGPVVEKVGEAFTVTAEAVVVTAAGGAEVKVGGTKLTARGGSLKVTAGDMGAKGGPMLKLKGRINYK